jgi:hypothetical protein
MREEGKTSSNLTPLLIITTSVKRADYILEW